MNPAVADVIIVGGGLAGSALALGLARTGVSVTLIERAVFPRDKPCGEGLLPHGVAKLAALGAASLLDEAQAQPFEGIAYRAHGVHADGDFVAADGTRETGFGVRRLHLDAGMHALCKEAPAVTFVPGQATTVNLDDAGCTVTLRSGTQLRGKILVGADGPRSMVRKTLGLDRGAPRRARYALRQHWALPAGTPMPTRVTVQVVGGYELYVTPVEPGVVGLAALIERQGMRDGAGDKTARLRTLVQRGAPAMWAWLEGATPASDPLACGPLKVRAKAVAGDRFFLVGDAAGYVDAITGEGMSLALGTAALAADAIHARLQGDIRAAAQYSKARTRVFRDHMLLTEGLLLLARYPALAKRAVAQLGHDPALFARLLQVNQGARSLLSLGAVDLARLAFGRRPALPAPPRAALPARQTAADPRQN